MSGSDLIYAAVGGGLMLAATAFPYRGRKAGRTTCIQCEYPLVDPSAAVCPSCGENPHHVPPRTGEWDMGLSLRRRRLIYHAGVLLGCGVLAGILAVVGLLVPRTLVESRQMKFRSQSDQVRLTLELEVASRLSAVGGTKSYVDSTVRVSAGSKAQPRPHPFTYDPDHPQDGFLYTSSLDGSQVQRALDGTELYSWLTQEVGAEARDPQAKAQLTAEANRLAFVIARFKPPMPSADLGGTLQAASPEFPWDASPPPQSETVGPSPALYPLAAILPYLVGVVGVETWHARRRRRYAPRNTTVTFDPSRSAARTLSIIFTDMVGYTEKVDRLPPDEILELIRVYRILVAAAVGARNGRIVKNQGDAFLVTFESGTDAVLSSLDLQREVRLRNATVAESQRFELRIGISTGQVAEEDGDVFGPPVNIASRVQHEAATGEVLFTEATARAMNHNEVRFELRGEFALKGVPHPVRVYVAQEPERAEPKKPKQQWTSR
jgi:class 3 adenylate cyclase